MAEVTMARALGEALRRSLSEDPRTLVLGEDVGRLGGVFRITEGLQDEFGEARVFDTPLAEAGIAGVCVGLAIAGWRPIAEMQFDAFSYPALDQVICHVAKMRYRSQGRLPMSIVIRIPYGGAIGAAEHHSESPETYYAHTAGLKVVVPSTPADAFGLLREAIADPDPVIFLEPKSRYWSKAEASFDGDGGTNGHGGEGSNGKGTLPIGRSKTVRDGTDCTVFAWGAMVPRALAAAQAASEHGTEVRVVDIRTLVPLDVDGIGAAVRETGRAVVVHEAPMTAGFGAEIVARIVEEAFDHLEAPVARVTGFDTPYPPATLEAAYVPSAARILAAIDRVVAY
jgi:2-oxoisovalerate dehydrogenase E1 component beta subunit